PQDPKEADKDEPGKEAEQPKQTPGSVSPQAMALIQAARKGSPFCEKCAEAAYAAAIAAGATPEEAAAAAERAGKAGAAAEGGGREAEAAWKGGLRGPAARGAGPAPAEVVPPPAPVQPLATGEQAPATPTETGHWVEIELVDDSGQPIANEPYILELPDGSK